MGPSTKKQSELGTRALDRYLAITTGLVALDGKATRPRCHHVKSRLTRGGLTGVVHVDKPLRALKLCAEGRQGLDRVRPNQVSLADVSIHEMSKGLVGRVRRDWTKSDNNNETQALLRADLTSILEPVS